MIMVNQNILILRPKFNIFWAIFIRLFLTFNTSDLGMNAVIQIDNLNDLDRILALEDVRVIVINNQSLSDFSININITEELLTARRSLIQKLGIVVISESGIETPDDLALLAGVGVQTVIMGESLLKENDLEVAVRNLLQAKFPINYQRNYT
jgi:indole-3-glycerol phosphate synthase